MAYAPFGVFTVLTGGGDFGGVVLILGGLVATVYLLLLGRVLRGAGPDAADRSGTAPLHPFSTRTVDNATRRG
jgi:hypothetical protein